jgi:hypothetical protein
MTVKRELLMLLGLLLIMGPVSAYYADSTSFGPSNPSTIWIIADNGQQNIINLVATNTSSKYYGPVTGAQVTFALDKPLLGTISPTQTQTDSNGKASCTFTVNSTQPTSGAVTITATIISKDGSTGATYVTIRTWIQYIDHNVPYTASFSYPTLVGLENFVPVNITITDRWGNLVENQYENYYKLPAHNLTLHVNGPSPPNNCGFTNFGLVHDKNFNLDSYGNVSANITPATTPGWHYILTDPMGSIPVQERLFDTIANGKPFKMTSLFSPGGSPYPTTYADGTSQFNFYYTLLDRYGNPTQNQGIQVTASDGTSATLTTIQNGEAWSTYGPKSFTGYYNINATALGNTSLRSNQTVRFYNTSPVNIDLSANPQSIPSRDAMPSIYSNISAKITDVLGNPVATVPVYFTLHDITDSPVSANETKNASFSTSTKQWSIGPVQTDVNGFATVKLYPAQYANQTEVGYNQQVAGTGTVTASWTDNGGTSHEKDIQISWKNYPYLSAVVAVYPPQNVKVGDIINVSIILNGDGWALVPKPADVVLVTDLSGSMDDTMGTGTKLSATKNALTQFVGMSGGKMFIGLASFANGPSQASTAATQLWNEQAAGNPSKPFDPYQDKSLMDSTYTYTSHGKTVQESIDGIEDARIDYDLTTSSSALNNTIGTASCSKSYYGSTYSCTYSGYQPNGGTDIASGLAAGLQELNAKGYPDHNQSIVLMTDGIANMAPINASFPLNAYQPSDYNSNSDSSQIAANAAIKIASTIKNQNIKIYTIAFGSNADTTMLNAIASPGCSYNASDATSLSQVYATIYGQLFVDAGVDTTATMDIGDLIVNGNPAAPGNYFSYVGNTTGLGSTMVDKYNKTSAGAINMHLIADYDSSGNPIFSSVTPFSSTGPIIFNQSTYYTNNNQNLAFNIGTIKVNDTWKADFQLQALQEGDIQIFGPDSKICFTNNAAGNTCMSFPNLSASVSMNPVNLGLSQTAISIADLTRTDGGSTDPVKGTIPISWTTVYNGNPSNIITEDVSYIHDNDPPMEFDVKTGTLAQIQEETSILDMSKLPTGGYTIQILAYTNDAQTTQECGPYSYITAGISYIKLQ